MGKTADKNEIKPASNTNVKLKRGCRLGKYRLQSRLGQGGSSEVWKAMDTVESIPVALKIPVMDVNGTRDNKDLLNEIKLVSRMRHRHLMPVKNADIISGHVVLATDLSTGTLDDKSRPMATRRLLFIIAQVLDGLAYAHRNRMVHCDVTPGNIFLFPNGRAALGDFGIGLKIKGKMVTSDVYGTPGYIAPEQAYGRPTYRSDCFSIAIIIYEYITGFIPRWPFNWPPKGYERLRERTNTDFVRFMKKALEVDPAKRFPNAEVMLKALIEATPKKFRRELEPRTQDKKVLDWHEVRRNAFVKRYGKVLSTLYKCENCGEPVAESMISCPWCGCEKNRFDRRTRFTHFCHRCHKGVLPEWNYCPWCYGAGFDDPSQVITQGYKYEANCKYCHGRIMRFMRYCCWCHRKVKKPWQIKPFPEICTGCGWSVDSDFWIYCPWCTKPLVT